MREELEKMKQLALNELSIMFNSDGQVLSKKQMEPFVRRTVLNKLNFAIWYSQEKRIECLDLIELKHLLMSQK
jgi:hypothetical protein